MSVHWVQWLALYGGNRGALETKLGPLADWFLEGRSPSALPQEAARVVLLLKNEGFRGLAEGIALPVAWERVNANDPRDDPFLPAKLREIAEDIRSALPEVLYASTEEKQRHAESLRNELKHWRLRLSDCLGTVDLSTFLIQGDSAWMPLAAALRIGMTGGRSKLHVYATGGKYDVRDEVFGSVEHVEAKVSAARRISGAEGCTVFVSRSRDGGGDGSTSVDGAHVTVVRHGKPLDIALGPVLAQLGDEPPESAELSTKLLYVNRPDIRRDLSRRWSFYQKSLANQLAEKNAAAAEEQGLRAKILISSLNPKNTSLLHVIAAMLRPTKLLLLYSPTPRPHQAQNTEEARIERTPSEQEAEKDVQKRLEELRPYVSTGEIKLFRDLENQELSIFEQLRSEVVPEDVVIDTMNGLSQQKSFLSVLSYTLNIPSIVIDSSYGGEGVDITEQLSLRRVTWMSRLREHLDAPAPTTPTTR